MLQINSKPQGDWELAYRKEIECTPFLLFPLPCTPNLHLIHSSFCHFQSPVLTQLLPGEFEWTLTDSICELPLKWGLSGSPGLQEACKTGNFNSARLCENGPFSVAVKPPALGRPLWGCSPLTLQEHASFR